MNQYDANKLLIKIMIKPMTLFYKENIFLHGEKYNSTAKKSDYSV